MDEQQQGLSDQKALWNGTGGQGWVALQDLTDMVFEPVDELLVAAVAAGRTSSVLDVGCGTGSTTVAVARHVGAQAGCTGIDISEPMIAAARERAKREGLSVSFVVADAETHPFVRASFDAVISRFGVMFFSDPVAAFANLRSAARTGGALHVVAWRSPDENPFMTAAERAAAPLLPELPVRVPGAPGQFAFADRDRVYHLLEQSGWSEIDIQPIDVTCCLPEAALVRYLSHLGPVGRVLQQADDELRARVIARVRPAFEPYVHDAEVRFSAACWMVGAQAV